MHSLEQATRAFQQWFEDLKKYRNGLPAKGTVAGALVVLERLQINYDLHIDAHTAEGGSQITGASGSAVARILHTFDEVRPFVAEGGRTNRGLRGDISSLLNSLRPLELEHAAQAERL